MLFLEKIEQKKFYIVLVMLICILMGIVYTICFIPPKNISSATLVCLKTEKNSEGKLNNTGNLELSKNIVSTFEEIAKSKLTIKEVQKDVNIDVKSNEITLNKISNSDTFSINIKNTDSNNIVNFSNRLVDVFSKKVEDMLGNVKIYVIDAPHIEKQTYGYSFVYAILVSLGISVLIIFVYIIFLIQFDKKIKSVKDIESDICIKNLGIIPLNTKNKEVVISYSENSKTQISKAFRKLRANIQFVNVNNKGKNTILITSPKKFEGKSYISANLAVSFAEVGKKVILIDADMESGNQSRIFNIPNNLGLSNYLSGLDEKGIEINELINKFINETEIKNLNIVTSGSVPPNSSELLTSTKLEELIKDLSVFYDVLIVDGPSVLAKTDSLILTRTVNSTILVSNHKKTNKDDLWQAKKDIQNVGGRIIGNVLNKTKLKEKEKIIKTENKEKIEKVNESKEKLFLKYIKTVKNKILEIKNFIKDFKNKSEQKLLLEAKEPQKKVENDYSTVNYIMQREETVQEEISQKQENLEENVIENKDISTENLQEIEVKTIYKNEENDIKNENTNNIQEKNNLNIIEKIKLNSENIFTSSKNSITSLSKKIKYNFDTAVNKAKKEDLQEEKYIAEENEEKVIETESAKEELNKKSFNKNNSQEVTELAEELSKEIVEENDVELTTEIMDNEEIQPIDTVKELENDDNFVDELKENDDAILVIVDADNAICRVFNKHCFTAKLVRGIDSVDGLTKAHYSAYLLKKRIEGLMNIYNLNKKQAERVDTLIYETLETYDDTVWIERKIASNKAESYIRCITQEYEKMPEEDEKEYQVRCQILRKQELRKELIEIEYNLDGLWKTKKMNFADKIVMNRFAGLYDVETKIPFLKSKELQIEQENLENDNYKIKKNMNFDKIKYSITSKISQLKENFSNIKVEQVKIKTVEEIEKEVLYSVKKENIDNNDILLDKEHEEKKMLEEIENKRIEEERKRELEFLKEKKREEKMIQKRIAQEEKKAKKMERIKKREEAKKSKEIEKQKQKQEARIEEELLVDNLYPKTKNNKDI